MKTKIHRSDLAKGLSHISRFVSNKSALPILSNVLITVDKKAVKLRGASLDSGVEVVIPAESDEEGVLCANLKLLQEIVGNLSAEELEFSKSEEGMEIDDGSHKVKLGLVEAEEFPEAPEFDGEGVVSIMVKDLVETVSLVGFSASQDEARPVLSSLLFEFFKKTFSVVATDGYRLSKKEKMKFEGELSVESLLLSRHLVSEVVKVAESTGSEKIEMSLSGASSSVRFSMGSVSVVARLIEGEFPSYKKILPDGEGEEFVIDKEMLIETMRVASIFSRESSHIVKLMFGDGRLKISSQSSGVGKQESVLEIKGKSELQVAFNSRFLLDFLTKVGGSEIKILLSEPLKPGLFLTQDKDFVHVIMPVRTQQGEAAG